MDYKSEDGAYIKPDPETASPAVMDDDNYEDTGELEFPRDTQAAWLMRLPKLLHSAWAKMDADEPIQIGTIRQWKPSGKMQLWLNPNLQQHQGVSKQYDIRTAAANSHNTYVFSEKDLPGYKSGVKSSKINKSDDKKDVLAGADRGVQKQTPFYNRRRAIPKQTALSAKITKELVCNAVDMESEARTRRLDAEDKKGITILKGDVRNYARMVIDPTADRTVRSRANFDSFKTESAPAKPKAQENKTARMPENELLDALYDCFKKYRYWSMTALRQELHQPEQYLRQTLLKIAEQVKSGPFNNNWKLRDEQGMPNINLNTLKEESAPQREGAELDVVSSVQGSDNDDDDDDDEDDDLQMEDVGI